jgi:L-rhamnose-H+ transport protein
LLALASGVANGLFTAPLKLERRWRWEQTWAVFIVTSCLVMPAAMVAAAGGGVRAVIEAAPAAAGWAVSFGFLWGFGAICFGLSVKHIGVSMANSLVLGVSSALGSLVPLALSHSLGFGESQMWLYSGIAAFVLGVASCGRAGVLRDRSQSGSSAAAGYVLAIVSGVLSAIFNIGYTLALPLAAAGERLGDAAFPAANRIWLLMLGAGAVPNLVYCGMRIWRGRSAGLLAGPGAGARWGRAGLMGLLWGGSIFLYGAAAPLLGKFGSALGWPVSLAAGLVTANLMGVWLKEWRGASASAVRLMWAGLGWLGGAIVLCAAAGLAQ